MQNINFLIAVLISTLVMFGWSYFSQTTSVLQVTKQERALIQEPKTVKTLPKQPVERVKIKTTGLEGSISLRGARIDDLKLLQYKKDLNKSDQVQLLSPSGTNSACFIEFGWFDSSANTELPNSNTLWQADKKTIVANEQLTLRWVNKDNVEFVINISVDDQYMFQIEQAVINNGANPISFQLYGLLNKIHDINSQDQNTSMVHHGAIATISDKIKEYTYKDLKSKVVQRPDYSKVNWVGFTDKYWLTSLIPDNKYLYVANFRYADPEKYQIDFISEQKTLAPGQKNVVLNRAFSGAKKVQLLDTYEAKYSIKLFDRAIDFGWFYVITKPLFHILNFFYKFCGNFGVSILIVTVIIKALLYGVTNKSYKSMKRMKDLQPELERLKVLYKDDKYKMNEQVMNLYKKHKINPLGGMLLLFLQIPIFFSIYKVLCVTIEMRHAPFFGWIRDLSAADPTSILTLFGLIPVTLPNFMHIGVWPVLMALTMFLQQKLTPTPTTDPVQAQVMQFLPLVFLFMFSNFPSGLLIYWTWSNLLSIAQQYYINKNA